ncbi:hypothetical protein HPP92_023524 [Vanilla planifolia]|uniref:Pectinesterase n=1 Tax=Vanilla planifolia TaxID=51239 RepID=A0A835PYP0_VANPL|nr:hypothetical protein HPP92_023524 [Vanilla planifolia]
MATFHSLLATFLLLLGNSKATNALFTCDQTPYPELCHPIVGPTPPITRTTIRHIRELAIQSTIDLAQSAHRLAKAIDISTLDESAKAAWPDCLELCLDTIENLNSSLPADCSHDNSQTWLSASFTNQQTCLNGFAELHSSLDFTSSPFHSTNISNAICNLLSINKAYASASASALAAGGKRKLLSGGFPKWVSARDRKLLQSSVVTADLVVAKDGTGDYETISEAVAAAAKLRNGSSRFVIHVKAGVYNEQVEITSSMKNLMIVGDGIGSTVVTGSKNVVDGSTTFRSATFAAVGSGFIARDITFENSAGPEKHQAVAVRSGSDHSVFYKCSFNGYQDTLYVHSKRQFYKNCDIYGTVDFIFGDAVVVFQSCNIYIRKPMDRQQNIVTAQGRTDPNENTGISIHDCVIDAAPDLAPVVGYFRSYLGRPWKQYSRTVVMKTNIGSLIHPAGWLEWSGSFALETLYYGEYMNTGAGSDTSHRVNWPGYHVITNDSEAGMFTVRNFLSGDSWIPATGVPFNPDL